MAFWDNEKEITRFEKNKKETVIIKEVSKGDKSYIDVRTFLKDENDELKPLQKGVAIPKEKAKEAFQAVINTL